MGSIIKKKIKNKNYYYYVESKRIDGKPKLVNQKYLGSAEKLLNIVLSSQESLQDKVLYSHTTDFGSVTLLYDIALRLGIIDIIDSILPKRKQGASIGSYILTATINRAVSPTSTNRLQEWYSSTALPMLTGIKPSAFTPQNFWNNTCITAKEVEMIEEAILQKMLATYKIDTSHIIYDPTNFFTYIDTMKECDLAKRGRCKHKRNDLRLVGLALMVTPNFSIPLLHDTYPGNLSDAKQFPVMISKLKSRYEAISGMDANVTVIFDRGNNSEDNIVELESGETKFHYIGGLKKNQAEELFEIDRSEYTALTDSNLSGNTAYRTLKEVFGRVLTVLIVHNPELENGQLQGIKLNKEKTTQKLMNIQENLMRRANGEIKRGKKPTRESITSKVEKLLKVEYMKELFSYEILESRGFFYLTFAYSEEALERVKDKWLGKTVLFTDREELTDEEIVNAYRSSWHVEYAFRQMKNTDHLTVRPIFKWTDEKINVHMLICVLAYRLCCLLVKELSEKGIEVNINKMLDSMSEIKQINTFFGMLDKPEKVKSFTVGNDLAQQVEELYQLKQKYS